MIHSAYLDDIFRLKSLRATLKKATTRANKIKKKLNFDGLVGTGISGIILIAPLALELKVPFAIVRKSKKNHSGYDVEGDDNISRYLFVDDFIDSGETFSRVYKKMKAFNGALPIGALFYLGYNDFDCYLHYINNNSSDIKSKIEKEISKLDIPFYGLLRD